MNARLFHIYRFVLPTFKDKKIRGLVLVLNMVVSVVVAAVAVVVAVAVAAEVVIVLCFD